MGQEYQKQVRKKFNINFEFKQIKDTDQALQNPDFQSHESETSEASQKQVQDKFGIEAEKIGRLNNKIFNHKSLEHLLCL